MLIALYYRGLCFFLCQLDPNFYTVNPSRAQILSYQSSYSPSQWTSQYMTHSVCSIYVGWIGVENWLLGAPKRKMTKIALFCQIGTCFLQMESPDLKTQKIFFLTGMLLQYKGFTVIISQVASILFFRYQMNQRLMKRGSLCLHSKFFQSRWGAIRISSKSSDNSM